MRKAALALAIIVTLSAAYAAEDDTLGARIAEGLQQLGALVTDVIVDLTQDVRITIPSRTIITAEVPPPPRYDLTAKIPERTITKAEVPVRNQQRKNEFTTKQTKKAPKDQELPPFRMVLTPQVEDIISRGTIFNTEQTVIPPNMTTSRNGVAIPADASGRLVHNELAQQVRGHLLTSTPQRMIVVHKRNAASSPIQGEIYGNLVFTTMRFDAIEKLRAGPTSPYLLFTVDTRLQADLTATDTLIQGPLARNTSGALGAVGVCIIDTGIDYTLPAFTNNYVGGTDFVNNDSDPLDDEGHGTQMANAVVKIAPGAQLYAAKALDNTGTGYASDAIQAIDWCMQQNVSVITMSFGGGTFPSWCDDNLLAQKANEAVARGFFVVAAAGNTGAGLMHSPACASLVTSVGATDTRTNETIWNSSSLTPVTDILAPGVSIQTIGMGGSTVVTTGTSVSAAVLAGAGAVVAEATALNPQPLQDLLRSTGIIFTQDNASYPRVDLYRALTNQSNNMSLVQNGTQSNDTVGKVVKADSCTYPFGDPCQDLTDGAGCVLCDDCTGGTIGQCSSGTCGGSPITCSQENLVCCSTGDSCLDNPGAGCTVDGCFMGGDNDGDGANDNCDTDCAGATTARGAACTCDYECSSSDSSDTCKTSMYQGAVTAARCAAADQCIDGGGTVRADGYNAGADTCYGGTGSVWLANSGRWVVKNTGGTVLAVIDKYGSAGFRGSITMGAGAFDSGWQIKQNGGGVTASINSANGNMRTAGNVGFRGPPSCTGFQVKNTGGTIEACWSSDGFLDVRGDYASNLGSLA